MQINVSNLSQGIHTYELEADPQDLGVQELFHSTIYVTAMLEKTYNQMLLETTIRAGEGHFHCDRCIDEFNRITEGKYRKIYVIHDEDAVGVNPDELEILSPDTNIIDITQDVRDAILLAIPLKLLCREDCAGLCPRCGENLNNGKCQCSPAPADERWEPLSRLLRN